MEVRPVADCAPDQLAALFAEHSWPVFIDADAEAAAALPRVRARFRAHELALVDGDTVVAAGWGVPLAWDGTRDDLPGGYTDALVRSLADDDHRRAVDTFVLCAIQVRPDRTGQGQAARMVTALTGHARRAGLHRVIAPLRPTLKHRYPLTPIASYAGWTRTDGAPFDPWLRLHSRLGAELLGVAERSQTFTGSVAQWQEWSGLTLPASGSYVVPEALAPLTVDHAADRAVLVEPGIWIRHGPQG